MGIVPRNNVEKLGFFENHIAKWLQNAGQIGTSTEQVEALQVKVQAARAAFKAQQAAQLKARSATLAFNTALNRVARDGAAIIQQIRAAALQQGNGVYPLASIRPPRKRRPMRRPGKPFNLVVELQANGALTLRWECDNPRGSMGIVYHLWRQIGNGDGLFTFLGIAGGRRFVDEKVPAGTSRIIYRIQAIRTRAHGPAAEFPVSLGGVARLIGGPVIVPKNKPLMIAA